MGELKFNTKAIHGKSLKKDVHNAIKQPIYAGVAYDFDSAEDLEAAFTGKKPAHAYSRITNPTVEALENKITALEGGLATIATSSGMAAIANVLINLLQKGDNLVSAGTLFGGTYSLLAKTLQPIGVETRFVDITNLKDVASAIDKNTKVLFFETIANPQMNVPDVKALAEIAKKQDVVVVVDSTVTSPYLFPAKDHGANIVIHSTTKFISGGATSVGGAIVDLGNYDWTKITSLKKFHRFKDFAFIARLRKEVYRDLGSCLDPQSAYLQSVGLETLALRVERSCENTLQIAKFLKDQKAVKSVDYPGLPDSPYHALAKKQFNGRYGGILAFELKDQKTCFSFLNKLKLIKRATNLGDNTTLIIHPASTIFTEYDEKARLEMGVTDGLIRLSVGIEDVEDLIADIKQALKG